MQENTQPAANEIARLENEIQKTQAQIARIYFEFGKLMYDVAERHVQEINRLTDRLISLKKTLAQAKGETICTNCSMHNEAGNRFCSRCGSPLCKKA